MMANKQVLIIIAEESETVEIVAPVDILRRTEGVSEPFLCFNKF